MIDSKRIAPAIICADNSCSEDDKSEDYIFYWSIFWKDARNKVFIIIQQRSQSSKIQRAFNSDWLRAM